MLVSLMLALVCALLPMLRTLVGLLAALVGLLAALLATLVRVVHPLLGLVRVVVVRAMLVPALLPVLLLRPPSTSVLVTLVTGLLLIPHVPGFAASRLVRPPGLLLAVLCALVMVAAVLAPVLGPEDVLTVPHVALLGTGRLAVFAADASLVLCTGLVPAAVAALLAMRSAASLFPRSVDLRPAGRALSGAIRMFRRRVLSVADALLVVTRSTTSLATAIRSVTAAAGLVALSSAPRQDTLDERPVLLSAVAAGTEEAAVVTSLIASVLPVRSLIAS